jgi:hypothetical protein
MVIGKRHDQQMSVIGLTNRPGQALVGKEQFNKRKENKTRLQLFLKSLAPFFFLNALNQEERLESKLRRIKTVIVLLKTTSSGTFPYLMRPKPKQLRPIIGPARKRR